MSILFFSFFTFTFSLIFFYKYNYIAKKLGIIDNQKNQVNKSIVPTSGGIIFPLTFLITIIYLLEKDILINTPNRFEILIISILFLTAMCLYDDIKTIHPVIKLLIHLTIAFFCLACLELHKFLLPLKLTMIITVYFWVYYLNTINFLDGLDGFLAIHSIFLLVSIFLINFFSSKFLFSYYFPIILLPTLIAFWFFNKPKAKLFMGDTGSIFLGFIFGFAIIELVLEKKYLLALSLCLYPITDCTITIFKKVLAGHKPWARLFDYFFLRPVMKFKKSHLYVHNIFLVYNIINTLFIFLQLYYSSSIFFIGNIVIVLLTIYIFTFKKLFFLK